MNLPFVSVIVACFNHERYITSTINSIINQSYNNIELLIIDDGSIDDSYKKILITQKECKKRFKNFYIEKQNNHGTAFTTDKLIRLAKGDYIFFIASDDVAKPDAIEKQINFLINNPDYGLVVGNNEIIDMSGKRCFWNKNRENVYDLKKSKYKTVVDYLKTKHPYFNENFGKYPTLYMGNYIPNGFLVKKECLLKILPFSKDAPLEDWYIMLQLSKFYKFKYLDEILYSYRWHPDNTVKKVERLSRLTKETLDYENRLLSSSSLINYNKEVKIFFDNGYLYKKIGIPFVIELLYIRKVNEKIKLIKLFNFFLIRVNYNA